MMKSNYPKNRTIVYTAAQKEIPIQIIDLNLVHQDNELSRCNLHFLVDWKTYQTIESQSLFHYDSNLRGSMLAGEFLPYQDIEVTAILRPDLLPDLEEKLVSAETGTTNLQILGQESSSSLFLCAESWLALSVKQQKYEGETGFRTFWDYFNWDAIAQDNSQHQLDQLLLDAITSFFKDITIQSLSSHLSDEETNQSAIDISIQLFEKLFAITPSLSSQDEENKQHIVNAVTDTLKQSVEANLSTNLKTIANLESVQTATLTSNNSSNQSFFQILKCFFQQQTWAYFSLPEQSVIYFDFQGKHDKWECYAQVREAEQQLVFYSVLPMKVAKKSRHLVAEFLTRANYGLILGNFEMDFNDGEIRYKTSIGVEGSHLDFALIQQVVYSNLSITDKYLPGILQVMNGQKLPATAIVQIEQSVS
ncbi:YbjN domain-containing protein [Pantanalinema rosaneae CENA516]|uniref:YbjN domain-containing protein n=1 Tax=Pantanalinema rosaneae TaxID=1620701 RepID=UPI003D6FE5CE